MKLAAALEALSIVEETAPRGGFYRVIGPVDHVSVPTASTTVCPACGGVNVETTLIGTIVGDHDPNTKRCHDCGKVWRIVHETGGGVQESGPVVQESAPPVHSEVRDLAFGGPCARGRLSHKPYWIGGGLIKGEYGGGLVGCECCPRQFGVAPNGSVGHRASQQSEWGT